MPPFQSIDALLEYIEAHPEQFIRWLESNLDYAELKELAASELPIRTPRLPFWRPIVNFFIPDLQSICGRSYVDATLKQDIENKSKLIAATNALNIIPAAPLIIFGLARGVVGCGLALAFGIILFGATNWTAQRAITEQPREKQGGFVTLVGIFILQMIPSFLSGPGTILLIDEQSLAQRWAETQVEITIEDNRELSLQKLEVTIEQAQFHREQCDELLDEINQYSDGSDAVNRLFWEMRGFHQDIEMDRSDIPFDELDGVCWKAERLESMVSAERLRIEEAYGQAKQDSTSLGSLAYLKQIYPERYTQEFTPEETLISGVQATQLATQFFLTKVSQGEFDALIIPLLFFLTSTTLSLLMVLKLRTYRDRVDVLRSFDPSIALFRDELFHRAQIGLLKQQQQLECFDAIDISSHDSL